MKSLLLIAIFARAFAQNNIKDPVKDFCRRHLHQTCVIDSKLYIDGGMVYYNDHGDSWDDKMLATQNTALLYENVNDTENEEKFPVQYSNLSKGPEIPSVSGGVLWPDSVNKYFYLFGGEYDTPDQARGKDSQGVDLWRYDTIYNNWTKTKPHSTQNKVKWPAFGAGAVHEDGSGYYYGGYLTNKSTSGWTGDRWMLDTFVKYDMKTTEWSNTTIDRPRAEGTLQYVPASDAGMLVYLGGLERDPDSRVITYSNMSRIQVYDIGDQRWYTQEAGGDIPQPRRGFCAGTVWAKDKSSYNIYIFGGISANSSGLGDIYVLSLPSFQWLLVTPDPNQDIFPKGKMWSSCNIIQDSQFMVIGGYYVNKTETECDVKVIGGQHAAFLGQESVDNARNGVPAWWHRPENNVTRYRVPGLLTKVIGGNNEGGATARYPPGGWKTNTGLAVYFGTTYSAVRTATREIPSATNSPSGSGNKPNVGAIAGGAVGGVVVLIGIIAFVFFCLRSRRRKRDAQAQSADNSRPVQTPHGPERARKSVASVSVSQGSTLHSPHPQSSSWAPQGSPPPPNSQSWHSAMPVSDPYYRSSPSTQHHMSGDWGQPGEHVYHQTYYPPPPDPSQSPKRQHMHQQSVEMPSVRSPANLAEMPQMRSPAPVRGYE